MAHLYNLCPAVKSAVYGVVVAKTFHDRFCVSHVERSRPFQLSGQVVALQFKFPSLSLDVSDVAVAGCKADVRRHAYLIQHLKLKMLCIMRNYRQIVGRDVAVA